MTQKNHKKTSGRSPVGQNSSRRGKQRSASLLPGQNFALAERHQVAAVTAIDTVGKFLFDRKAPGSQLPQVQIHEYGAVNTIEAERRQEGGPFAEEPDGAAFHAGSNPNAGLRNS